MGITRFSTHLAILKARALARAKPGLLAVALLLGLYASYLPFSGYDALYYDANNYWELGRQYGKTGAFQFLSFTDSLRGYFFPLLLAPLAILGPHIDCSPIALMRPLGAIMAAVLFGALGPALWRAIGVPTSSRVSLFRRLVFGVLGFALWRDYFNFSLTDFPALFALATTLWALLSGRSVGKSLLSGVALGAAVNMRPVLLAALPFVGLLALLPEPDQASPAGGLRRQGAWAHRGVVALGLTLVLAPQFYLNKHHFGVGTPWVLARQPAENNGLYLKQLSWGLQYQKYETNIGKDYPTAEMFFLDQRGAALLNTSAGGRLGGQSQYLVLALQHPLALLGVWQRHLFNGLDLQYPSPYIKKVYVRTWPLAWLNYTVLFGGLAVLLSKLKRRGASLRVWLVLAALLMPCVAAVPVAVECRFFLPLHLVLSAAVAFGAQPMRAWRTASGWQRVGWVTTYAVVVAACFMASVKAQNSLEHGPRALFALREEHHVVNQTKHSRPSC